MSIIIYSTPACPFCRQAKSYLEERGFEYTDVNVSSSQEKAYEMVQKSGQMGVPVIEINGQMIVGFDKEKINELLNIK